MAAVSDLILSSALEYASYGWRVVPLHAPTEDGCTCRKGRKCASRGKHPRYDNWQILASVDEEQIVAWWTENPNSNLGIHLGEKSGIIDFEGDGPDAEKTLFAMFGGDPPVTPTYIANRGKHRIFRWRGDLPGQGKNNFKVGDLEIRTGYGGLAAQSVFPPSIHYIGTRYKWLVSPAECPPAVIPDAVQAWLWNWFDEPTSALQENRRAKKDWDRIAEGVGEGERNDTLASYVGRLLSDLGDPFDNGAIGRVYWSVRSWNERNQPPLGQDELKATFDSIVSRHRQRVTSENANEHFERERPTGAPKEWRLIIVESRPRKYRLYSPLWSKKTKYGYIELTSRQMMSPSAVREQALEQADVWIDASKFDPRWRGGKGVESLARQLVESAEHVAAEPEEQRDVVVAEAVLSCLERARVSTDDSGPDPRGRPVRMSDGSVWFQVGAILEDVGYTLAKIKHSEVVDAIKEAGATSKGHRSHHGVKRYKVMSRNNLRSMAESAAVAHDEHSVAPLQGAESMQNPNLTCVGATN